MTCQQAEYTNVIKSISLSVGIGGSVRNPPDVAVVGRAGVGKSHLLDRVATWATGAGFVLGSRLAGGEMSAPGCPRELASVRAVLDLSTAGPAGPPILVVVDDADRAEPARLRYTLGCIRHQLGRRVRFVLAGRPLGGSGPGHWSGSDLAAPVDRISVGALSGADVRRLLGTVLGVEPADDLVALTARAHGNARLVCAMVDGLAVERRLHRAGDRMHARGTTVPRGVEDVVAGELANMSSPSRHLVRVAASLGPQPGLDVLGTLMGTPVAALLPLLDEADSAGLLTLRDELTFPSEMVRLLVRDTLARPVREQLAREATGGHARPADPAGDGGMTAPTAPHSAVTAWETLGNTEQEISRLVSAGLTNRQIATRVHLSPHTVNYYLRQIFRKLDIHSRIVLATLVNDLPPRRVAAGR